MELWFVVWIFLTVFIFGVFFWSMRILLLQKRAWTLFATRHGMQIEKGALLASPAMRGRVGGFDTIVFSEEQEIKDGRHTRFRTIIQMTLNGAMATGGIVVSPDQREFADTLNLPNAHKPDVAGWNDKIIIRVQDLALFKPYLTDERLRSINTLMSMKNYSAILIFDPQNTILRLETADPFDDDKRLEKFVFKLAEQAKVLSPV